MTVMVPEFSSPEVSATENVNAAGGATSSLVIVPETLVVPLRV